MFGTFSEVDDPDADFGTGDFKHLFQTFGNESDVTFQLHPAVRVLTATVLKKLAAFGKGVTLCAFNQTNTAGKVAFLACMDGRAAAKETYTQAALNAAKGVRVPQPSTSTR